VLTWKTASRLPWNIVLLFGGGFALAAGFKESGLSSWMGEQLKGLGTLPPILIIACICLLITFLTELTSNTATAEILLPILAALAVSIRVNPLLLMIPGTLSCSFAFMLPVATPPNAIVFGTDRLRVSDMARVGVIFNLMGAVVITLAVFLIGKAVFGIDLSTLPSWMPTK
jgi:sodium-dependent dicarboxylate transporter 2/3/5